MTPEHRKAIEIMHFEQGMSQHAIQLDFMDKGVCLDMSDIQFAIDAVVGGAAANLEDGIYLTEGGNRVIVYCGESRTVSEWSRVLNISARTLYERIRMGWDSRKIIQTPLKKIKRRSYVPKTKYNPYARRKVKPVVRQSPGPQARADAQTQGALGADETS